MSPLVQEKVDAEGPEGRVGDDEPPTEAGAAASRFSRKMKLRIKRNRCSF